MERTIRVRYNGETIAVTYDPALLDKAYAEIGQSFAPRVGGGLLAAAAGRLLAEGEAVARAVEVVVMSWDLEQDGAPYPPTRENISQLPIALLYAIANAIDADAFQLLDS
jgi:hypothetical protein